jgi:hypothetical protein
LPHASAWIADKLEAIDDPEFQAICLEYDAAIDWSPDDPRLAALADRAERWLAGRHRAPEDAAPVTPDHRPPDRDIGRRIVPAWDRLAQIAQERKARP